MLVRRLLAVVLLASGCAAAPARDFEGVVSHVTDGDSLWVRPAAGAAPLQVRLRGIDAPEICQSFGVQARDALAARLLHRRVAVASRSLDNYQRILGQVTLEGEDVGAWMVSRGYAWSYRFRRDGGPYATQEKTARGARLGLWAQGGAMRPAEFRKRHGSCR
ncbi:MAG: thermonuclease family protein [Ramlibacter sp.]